MQKVKKPIKELLENDSHYVWEKITEVISTYNPRYIGLTCLTPMKDIILKISKMIKTINKEIIVIIGGHHPTFCTDEMLNSPYIDYIVKGGRGVAFTTIIETPGKEDSDFYKINGVAYKHNGDIISNDRFEYD